MLAALITLLLIGLILFGVPIAFSLLIAGAIGLYFSLGFAPLLGILKSAPYATGSDFVLSTIPMFVLMAELLAAGTIVKDIFQAGDRFFSHLKGGLAFATTIASALIAALMGSSPAAAATMSAIAVPEMRQYGYKDKLSLGVVSAAGTLAVMIPPSIILILYGILTETSIGKLFLAGVVPGLLTAGCFIAVIAIWVRTNKTIAPKSPPKHDLKERLRSLRRVYPALLLILLVLGGIYGGVVTASEAGALGAAGALIIGFLVGGLNRTSAKDAFVRAIKTSSMIFAIVVAAAIYGYFLSSTQVVQDLIAWIEALGLDRHLLLVVVLLVYLVLGAFLDPVSILVITLPLGFPLMMNNGFDPVWFGIVVTKMVEIGLITPPVGINVFVASAAVDGKISEGFSGVLPFVICELFLIVLFVLFPEVVTCLPNLFYGA